MNRLLYGYVNKDPSYTYILENREIWLIPIINADAYIFIENRFKTKKVLTFLKKNMKIDNYTNANQCGEYKKSFYFYYFLSFGYGIDLNCNFPFQFNTSQKGCSNNPCDSFYRGLSSLSEKETQLIDNFLKTNKFNLAVNYFR